MIGPHPAPPRIADVKQPKLHPSAATFGLWISAFGFHCSLPPRRQPCPRPSHPRPVISRQRLELRQPTVIGLNVPVIDERCAGWLISPLEFHIHLLPRISHECLQR